MHPSSPLDLIRRALGPLVQQLEALGHVLELCAAYYAWCVGCGVGLAVLLLTGLVLQEAREGGSEDGRHEGTTGAREPQPARGAELFERGLNG